ncbi:MAG: hypothetical protein QM802_03490 [Agriterribacter sp.]
MDDAIYSTTLLGKRKLIPISDIYDMITYAEVHSNYSYALTKISKASAAPVMISSFISTKRKSKPEFIFLEQSLFPGFVFLHPQI